MDFESEIRTIGKGRLVYQPPKVPSIVTYLILFYGIAGCFFVFGDVLNGTIVYEALPMMVFPLGVVWAINSGNASRTAFYEQGVLLYQKNKPTQWIPYESFEWIEAYDRRSTGKNKQTYHGVRFYLTKSEELVTLERSHLMVLDRIWVELLKGCPQLNEQLQPEEARQSDFKGVYDESFHNRTYEYLRKGENSRDFSHE